MKISLDKPFQICYDVIESEGKMETIDRELVKQLRGQIQDAIEGWWNRGGENIFPKLSFHVGNATFTESNINFKVEVALVGNDGEAKTKVSHKPKPIV